MSKIGKYMYGVIRTTLDHSFGAIGLQGEEVMSMGNGDLAVLVSDYEFAPDEDVVLGSRKNMLAHQKTLEKVMEEFNVLPFSFGTVVESREEAQNLLINRRREFEHGLGHIEGRIELGLKVLWTDMSAIYAFIVDANPEIAQLKERIQRTNNQSMLIEVGRLVEQAVLHLKEQEASEILEKLSGSAIEVKTAQNITENMVLNASFFVQKSREKEFDNLVEELAEEMGDRIQLKYVGPLPPYSFIDMNIELAEWER